MARSTANSVTGSATELSPVSTMPASASASAAPVGSLSADSAMTVCATFGRSRERAKSGIRIAGSVGDSTAPTRKAEDQGRSKAKCAATPTTNVVIKMPGTASIPSEIQTLRSSGSDRVRPP